MTETAMPDTSSIPAVHHADPWMPITTPADEKATPSPDLAHQDDALAAELVRLIRTHPAVRRAVLGVVMSCPNVKWEV